MDSDPFPRAPVRAESLPFRPKGAGKPRGKPFHIPGWNWRVSLFNARKSPFLILLFAIVLMLIAIGASEMAQALRLYVLLASVFVLAGLLGLSTMLAVNGTIYECSEILFAPYGMKDEAAAYQVLYDYLITREAPVLVLQKGAITESTASSPMFKLGLRGPGFVRVDKDTALVLKKGKVSDVKRAGQYFLSKDEYLWGAADLTVQTSAFALEHVYTKDNIPLCVKGTLYYRIFQPHDLMTRQTTTTDDHGAAPPFLIALQRALTLAKWQQTVEITSNAKLRDLFAEFNLNDIHGSYPQAVKLTYAEEEAPMPTPPATRTVVQERLDLALNETLRQWGVEALKIVIHEVTLPVETERTLREAWATAWKNQTLYHEADNKAKVKQREAEGERQASDHMRVAAILKAQAEAEALRLTTTARTEATFEYMQRAEDFAKANGIKLDADLMREMLRTARFMTERPSAKKKRQGKAENENEKEKGNAGTGKAPGARNQSDRARDSDYDDDDDDE